MENSLNFNRIEYLLNPEQLKDVKITIVGLGSGGSPVCDHLTMNGIRNWNLFDPDVLSSENLVKHPRQRKDIGKYKTDIQKEWILDRNPSSHVNSYPENVFDSANFINCVKESDLVLSCPDKKSVREFINDICVKAQKPFITASVFRTGIGGEVYSYMPNLTGCYTCLQLFSNNNDLNLSDVELGLTEDEEDRIYGLNEQDYRASGLSMDIQMISLIQARMALSVLTANINTKLPKLKSNWIIFGNRPAKGIFKNHYEVKQMRLMPQHNCFCNKTLKNEV